MKSEAIIPDQAEQIEQTDRPKMLVDSDLLNVEVFEKYEHDLGSILEIIQCDFETISEAQIASLYSLKDTLLLYKEQLQGALQKITPNGPSRAGLLFLQDNVQKNYERVLTLVDFVKRIVAKDFRDESPELVRVAADRIRNQIAESNKDLHMVDLEFSAPKVDTKKPEKLKKKITPRNKKTEKTSEKSENFLGKGSRDEFPMGGHGERPGQFDFPKVGAVEFFPGSRISENLFVNIYSFLREDGTSTEITRRVFPEGDNSMVDAEVVLEPISVYPGKVINLHSPNGFGVVEIPEIVGTDTVIFDREAQTILFKGDADDVRIRYKLTKVKEVFDFSPLGEDALKVVGKVKAVQVKELLGEKLADFIYVASNDFRDSIVKKIPIESRNIGEQLRIGNCADLSSVASNFLNERGTPTLIVSGLCVNNGVLSEPHAKIAVLERSVGAVEISLQDFETTCYVKRTLINVKLDRADKRRLLKEISKMDAHSLFEVQQLREHIHAVLMDEKYDEDESNEDREFFGQGNEIFEGYDFQRFLHAFLFGLDIFLTKLEKYRRREKINNAHADDIENRDKIMEYAEDQLVIRKAYENYFKLGCPEPNFELSLSQAKNLEHFKELVEISLNYSYTHIPFLGDNNFDSTHRFRSFHSLMILFSQSDEAMCFKLRTFESNGIDVGRVCGYLVDHLEKLSPPFEFHTYFSLPLAKEISDSLIKEILTEHRHLFDSVVEFDRSSYRLKKSRNGFVQGDFKGYRPFVNGSDDSRHIDEKLRARTDRSYVKQFEQMDEEKDPRSKIPIVLDSLKMTDYDLIRFTEFVRYTYREYQQTGKFRFRFRVTDQYNQLSDQSGINGENYVDGILDSNRDSRGFVGGSEDDEGYFVEMMLRPVVNRINEAKRSKLIAALSALKNEGRPLPKASPLQLNKKDTIVFGSYQSI